MAVWVVILLVVMMVVGSVVWVRPSPRDKRLALWRRDAIMSGLKVKLDATKVGFEEWRTKMVNSREERKRYGA